MIRMNNDYNRGCVPAILDALNNTNNESYPGYGVDEACESAIKMLRGEIGWGGAHIHFLPRQTLLSMQQRCVQSKASSLYKPVTSLAMKPALWKTPAIKSSLSLATRTANSVLTRFAAYAKHMKVLARQNISPNLVLSIFPSQPSTAPFTAWKSSRPSKMPVKTMP